MIKKVKRITVLLLAVFMLLSLSACGKTETNATKSTMDPTALTNTDLEEKAETVTVSVTDKEEQAETEVKNDAKQDVSSDPAVAENNNQEVEIKSAAASITDDEELLTFELLDKPIACRTFFFQYISEDDAVFDLHSLVRDLGYKEDEEEEFVFSNPEQPVQVSLEEKEEENSQKIFRAIRYKTKEESILCTFERRDRFDGSTLYSINTPDNYTMSMDQILLLTYIMENLSDDNTDPLAGIYSSEYWTSGMYRFPI